MDGKGVWSPRDTRDMDNLAKVTHLQKLYARLEVKKSRNTLYMTLVQDPNMKHIGKSMWSG